MRCRANRDVGGRLAAQELDVVREGDGAAAMVELIR
jgi:hypothetical protein